MQRILAATVAVAAIGFAPPVCAGPVLSFDTAGGVLVNSAQALSLGWSFTTNAESIVVALDALDPGGANGSEVRLYDGAGALVASAAVTTGDRQEGWPMVYSHPIAPVTLAANATYYITQDVAAGTGAWFAAGTPATVPDITYLGPVGVLGLGLKPTTDFAGGFLAPAYFGPNFDIPEPAAIGILGVGLVALAGLRRHRAARAPRP